MLAFAVFLVHMRRPPQALARPRPSPLPTTSTSYRLPNPQQIPLTGAVHFQARSIVFHVMDGVHLNVNSVDALLEPTSTDEPVTLDDPESMKVQLLSAGATISAADMTTLLNHYALPESKLPIHSVEVSFQDNEVQITGKVHKVFEVPFKASATIGITPHGNFHLHFNKITVAGFLHKGVLDLLGLNIADLAKGAENFHVHDDDVDFPLHILFPAPHFSGHLQSVGIEGDKLVQVFGKPEPFAPAPVPAQHYIYLRGGVLDFGRLSMHGVDLELLNKEADQTFELSLQNVFLQALPGYMKNLPDHGLVAYLGTYTDHMATAGNRKN